MGASEQTARPDSENTQGPTRGGWLPFRIIRSLEYLPCPPCAMRDDEAEVEPSACLAVESLRGHCVWCRLRTDASTVAKTPLRTNITCRLGGTVQARFGEREG
jgi:hypothetical protein